MAPVPPSPLLSDAQLERLAAIGEERTAAVGDVLFHVGDREYPFMAIREGEVAIIDEHGRELLRHKSRGFLGEISLLTARPRT